MSKVFLFIALLFALKTNAQKAYDQVVYKGVWGNYNITLNYGYGYPEATEIVSIHKKTGARKVYNYNKTEDNLIYLANTKNNTSFSLHSYEEDDKMPKKITITIYFDGTQEDFVVTKK